MKISDYLIAPPKIVAFPDPRLKKKSVSVELRADKKKFIERMFFVTEKYGGIGLSAIQIGIAERIIVIKTKDFRQEFINPVIVKKYSGKVNSKEGCLSVPGKIVTKSRYRRVTIQGFDKNWEPISRNLRGVAACVVQHEMDHLDGILI